MAKASSTFVGVFSNPRQAQQAVNALRGSGFSDDQIGVVSHETSGADGTDESESGAAEGAATGVAAGAGLGALWGLGILAGVIPGIGTAIAGGTLGVLLSSAAAGAAAAGVGGALIGMGISEEDATYYENEYRAGRTIVTVSGPNAEAGRRILIQQGATSARQTS